MVAPNREMIDRVFRPVTQALGRDAAQRILALRPDDAVQQRVEYLADRNTEGQLTPEERAEYEALVAAGNFVATLKARAKAALLNEPAA